jgi:hypothetical protein
VLAVELLPFGQVQSRTTAGPPAAAEPAAAEPADDAAAEPAGDAAADAVVISSDPLGADLGSRRILRTSPLTALPAIC